MADLRYTVTDPFMAYPDGRLVRLSGEPAEAAVLDDTGEWRRTPSLDHFATDDTRPVLDLDEARNIATRQGHPDLSLTD